MRDFKEYIDDQIIEEGLLKWFKAFFTRLHDKYSEYMIKAGKDAVPIDIEEFDNIRCNRRSVALSDIMKDKKLVGHLEGRKWGYPHFEEVAENEIKLRKRFSKYGKIITSVRSEIFCYEYFVKGNPNIPCVFIMVTPLDVKKNYLDVLYFEINPNVNNKTTVIEKVFDIFIKTIKKELKDKIGFVADKNTYKGFEDLLKSIGFSKDNEEEDLLVYDF